MEFSSHFHSIMNSVQCDCPFCPLTERKVQVCDVLVLARGKDPVKVIKIPDQYADLGIHFAMLTLHARNTRKLKRAKYALDYSGKDYSCNVECVTKDFYKICFHAKRN